MLDQLDWNACLVQCSVNASCVAIAYNSIACNSTAMQHSSHSILLYIAIECKEYCTATEWKTTAHLSPVDNIQFVAMLTFQNRAKLLKCVALHYTEKKICCDVHISKQCNTSQMCFTASYWKENSFRCSHLKTMSHYSIWYTNILHYNTTRTSLIALHNLR